MNILLITLLEEINPLGLLHMATHLKENGHQVTTVFAPLNPKEGEFGIEENRIINESEVSGILNMISSKKPGIIGMSLMTIHYYSAVKLTRAVKRVFPEAPVVWGGIHPTLLPDECLQHADIVCRGEGEQVMLDLARCFEQGEMIENIENIWVRSGDRIIRNEVRLLHQDLDSLGFPRFDWENNYVLYDDEIRLLDAELYKICVPRKGRIYDVMTSRGCPYHCSYCCNANFKKMYAGKGNLLRHRSVESVIEELEYVKDNFDFVQFINFQDDVFLTRKADGWLDNFCEEYKKKINLPFMCKGSPREVTEKNISLLEKAGMEYFHVGLQNSDRVNREIYKRNTSSRDQVVNASKILNISKVVGRYDVILDDPFSTEEDILEVIDTLTKIKKPFMISCFSMTFFPGSEIYEMAKEQNIQHKGKNGYLLKTTYAERNYLNNLVEISPRVPVSVIRFFVKHRRNSFAGLLLRFYIHIHYNYIIKTMYTITKYPRLMAFAKDIRLRLRTA